MSSIAGIGLAGLQEASRQLAKTAERIANPSESDDLAADSVAFSNQSHAFEASAKVIKVADELSKTVLDILA